MVGGAASILSTRRAAGLVAVLALLVAWDAGAGVLPDLGHRPDLYLIALVVLPVTFVVPWLALPAAASRWIPHLAAALVGLSFAFYLAGFGAVFNVSKLLALIPQRLNLGLRDFHAGCVSFTRDGVGSDS